MNEYLHRVLATGFLLLAILTGCGRNTTQEMESGNGPNKAAMLLAPAERWQAPDFTLVSLTDGRVIASRELRGKVTLVTFISPWCGDCINEMRRVQILRKEFPDEQLAILGMGIGGQEAEKALRTVPDKLGITFPLLMADDAVRQGFGGVVAEPTAFLIDKHGKIARKFVNHLGNEALASMIRELSREP